MTNLMQDIRYALRQARKTPGFTLIAILTLALGVGAATAIFSVVDAVILRPLPFAQPERIVVPATVSRQGYTQPYSWLDFKDLRTQNHSFEAFSAAFDFNRVDMLTPSGPLSLTAVQGSDDFFKVFGVQPLLGRTYLPGEDQPGKNDIVVLSYEVWQNSFGGKADVIGKTVSLDGRPYTCIGVMPAGFRYPMGDRNAVYTPMHLPLWAQGGRGSHWLLAVARLKPGVSLQQAQSEMNTIMANLGKAYPDTDGGRRMQLIPVGDSVNGEARKSVWTLAAAVLAVLLMGCLNVAGLLLARGVKREREMALRAAIGANRTRLIRQVLTESLLLAFFGAAGGVGLAAALLAGMRVFLISAMQRGADVSLNGSVLAAAAVLAVLSSVAASLAPALRLSGTDPALALRSGGNAGTARGQHRVRSAFIVTQVALSLVLLVVAGVLLRGVIADSHQDLGFDSHHLLTLEIDLPAATYQGRNLWVNFYQPLEERIGHLPGVRGAGFINLIPVQQWGSNQDVHLSGQPPYPPNEVNLAETRYVTPGYFNAMGIRVLRGRLLTSSLDVQDNQAGTIVVNQAFVKKYIPSSLDPAVQHIDDSDDASKKTAIVGEITGFRQSLSRPSMPEMDWLITEIPPADMAMLMHYDLIVHTAGDPKTIIPEVAAVIHQLDPTLPIRAPETMEEVIADQLVMQRMATWLFGIFAGLALMLAVIGIYGLISQEVEMGTRDIGVRMALGATRASVMQMVLRRVAILLMIGVGGGFVLAYAAKKLIASVTVIDFGHQAYLLAGLAVAMLVIGIGAALLPARRAASIEPMIALRTE